MSRSTQRFCWIIAAAFGSTPVASADAVQFQFKAGARLTYQVENNTTVSDTLNGDTTKTVSRLRLTKQWQCVAVDENGVATLNLTITSLRNEQIRPNGESLVFDSEDPKKTTPGMKGMSKYVGAILAELRVSPLGEVVETKKSMTQFDSQLPFILQLPSKDLEAGIAWSRSFEIVLNPPLGTGEKYSAKQDFQCTKLQDGNATVTVKTQVLQPPKGKLDQIPLIAKQPGGKVIFNTENGFVERVELVIDREITGHQGGNSRYHFKSHYTEKRVANP